MYHCLNRTELTQLLDFKSGHMEIEDDQLRRRIEDAESWSDELGALTYTFACMLERKTGNGEDCQSYIELLYQLADEMFLRIDECNSVFVAHMLRQVRDRNLSLEEELIEFDDSIGRYEFR
jgi:hypothetical protein